MFKFNFVGDVGRGYFCFQDIHPILIGLAGAYLLCLPVVSPAENFYMEDFAFIGGLVCVLYAGGACIAQGIADRKARKAQSKKPLQSFKAKQAEIQQAVQSQIRGKAK